VARDKGDAHRVHPVMNGEKQVGVKESVTGELLNERAATEQDETPMLATLEAEITEGMRDVGKGGVGIGNALKAVRDTGLFRERDYGTFDDYLERHVAPTHNIGRAQAYRLIRFAEVAAAVSPNGDTLLLEAYARELARIKDADGRRDVWTHVKQTYVDNMTADRVAEEVAIFRAERGVLAPDDPRRAIVLDQVRTARERKKVMTRPKPKARRDPQPSHDMSVVGDDETADETEAAELAPPDPHTALRWMKALIELTVEMWESIRAEDPGTIDYFRLYCKEVLARLPAVDPSAD